MPHHQLRLTRRRLLASLPPLFLPMRVLAEGSVAHRLTVLHLNDFHSHHEPVDAAAVACGAGQEGCFGGAARLATALSREREAAEAGGRVVALVDAGDQFQGSLFFTAFAGAAERDVMHAIGTEAMAIGNHEFDRGPDTLRDFLRPARFAPLACNIAFDDPELAARIRPGLVLDKAGLKLGLIGLTTPETANISSPGPTVRFAEPGPAAATAAAALRGQGARVVLALSHLGWDVDQSLAGQIPGVDGFIGGHSHTLLSDSEPGAAGPAHAVFAGPAGRAVVVQAAAYGRYFGRLDLDIAADGTLLAYGGDCRHIGLDLPEDAGVAALVAGYAARLGTVRRRHVGQLDAELTNATCRVSECALGDLVTDAMLAATPGAQIALVNGGGLRAGLPAGPVTLGDVLTTLPFGNMLATFELTGTDLRAALIHGLDRMGQGGFPQIAGLYLAWNPLASGDARLVSVSRPLPDGTLAPLDPARHYRIVANNFLRAGGDGYAVLAEHAINPYDTGPPLDAALVSLLASRHSAGLDGRMALMR